ncbi:hypothetical protein [Caproicibacter fermentans]
MVEALLQKGHQITIATRGVEKRQFRQQGSAGCC